MKLIIDIPESAYDFLSQTVDCIANGIPLTESDDCVSRADVIEMVKAWGLGNTESGDIGIEVKNLPSVQPKRNKGEWKRCNFWYECTKCGYHRLEDTWYNFCPDCGADMRRGKE